jgi:two-component system, sensor histidine kinase
MVTRENQASADELDERRLQVVGEQARGLRWQVLATAVVVSAIAWSQAPPAAVIAWLVGVIVAREWRAALLLRLVSDRSTPIAARLNATVRSNALLGACNGAAAVFMLWLDPARDAILTMILVSWGAGAVSTSSTVMRAFIAYAGFLFVPTALMWFASASAVGLAVGALVLMFFGVQSRFARRNMETFEESFRIRLENDALARSLEAERVQLAAARDSAVQANQEKSRFLAAASHDLRQPLQAMSLNVGALQRLSIRGEPGAIVDDVALSLDQLRSMLDALLDLSKLDAGMVVPQLRAVQLDRLLASLGASLRALADDHGLALKVECPQGLTALTDAELLRRMLANLLDNAIKFTAQGGIELTARRKGGDVEISVQDSGPGIAQEHQQLIFEDLVQLDPRPVRGVRGHGLGLGIVRRLARLLRIDIDLDSTPGHGSTFRLLLPGATETHRAAEVAAASWSLDDTHVLVLDDDPMVRGAYARALASMQCRSVTAAHIDEAIDKLRDQAVQAAVVDYQLADANGFDAIERLRGRQPQLPVVMVTASVDPAVDARAAAYGIRLLRKPVDATSLGQALSQALAPRPAPS